MIKFPIKPLRRDQLEQQSVPHAVQGGQMEATWHTIYDTATYVDNTTTNLQFFNTARANVQLTNFGGRGQFPEPQFFRPHALTVDIIIVMAATSFSDMHRLLFGTGVAGSGAPTIELQYANKSYGSWPLSFAHGSGGAVGMSDTTTAVATNQVAYNSYPDGGIWLAGQTVTFAPNQQFQIDLGWAAAVDIAADINIRVNMTGEWFRRVT